MFSYPAKVISYPRDQGEREKHVKRDRHSKSLTFAAQSIVVLLNERNKANSIFVLYHLKHLNRLEKKKTFKGSRLPADHGFASHQNKTLKETHE